VGRHSTTKTMPNHDYHIVWIISKHLTNVIRQLRTEKHFYKIAIHTIHKTDINKSHHKLTSL
jgi:hypothetical protein